jgi:hypothetical protein
MKTKTISKIGVSVILGIMATLLLTLNIWGAEWYKLLVSLLVGVLVGLAVYDYRLITKSLKLAWDEIRKEGKPKKVKTETPKISVKRIGALLVRTIIILVNYGLYYLLFISFMFSVVPEAPEPVKIIAVILMASMILYILFLIVAISDDGAHDSTLVDSVYEKLGFLKKGYPRELNFNIFIWGMGWHVNSLLLVYLIVRLIILIILFIFQAVLSLLLAIVILFKLISHNSITILITFSIVAGGFVGTMFASYFVGIGSGLLILGGALISKKAPSFNIGYFFEGKRGWAGRFGDFS